MMPMQLSANEARVLGALMEKEIATPEYYPLSLNALLAAANQKSSREPVMTLTEDEVRAALRSLEDEELVAVDHGSRVQRYEHRARTVLQLRRDETALLCLLLLRGPQTPGELRGRADRLHNFDDIAAVSSALARLLAVTEQRPAALAMQLPRQPGAKEVRYSHALGDPAPIPGLNATPTMLPESAPDHSLSDRITRLEAAVEELKRAVRQLNGTDGGVSAA